MINESASGKSNIAVTNYNVFGHGAIDSNPYGNATKYSLVSLSIFIIMIVMFLRVMQTFMIGDTMDLILVIKQAE